MKKLLVMFLVLSLATPLYALTATEKVKGDKSVEITLTFTQDEIELFCLDKGTPKEWIRNAVEVNLNHQDRVIEEELYKELIFNTPENKAAKKAEKKVKRDEQIQKQIDQGDTEAVIY